MGELINRPVSAMLRVGCCHVCREPAPYWVDDLPTGRAQMCSRHWKKHYGLSTTA